MSQFKKKLIKIVCKFTFQYESNSIHIYLIHREKLKMFILILLNTIENTLTINIMLPNSISENSIFLPPYFIQPLHIYFISFKFI